MSSISTGEWSRYLRRMRALGDRASSELERFVERSGGLAAVDRDALIEYAYGLATMFGEGATALAAEMYDGVAQRQGVTRPPAEPAPTATISEVARAVNGTCKSGNARIVGQSIGRAVRLAGMDTTMKNAMRDGAEFAWIPSGDTCAFCMMLASNGWQRASKKTLKGDHCEHIHANCDCAFAIRFGDDLEYASYDPTPYKEMYDNAEGDNWEEKLNSMRRDVYAERSEDINAQKRAAYAARKDLTSSPDGDRLKSPESGKDRDILTLEDIPVGRSLGAARKAYDIADLKTGEHFDLVDGTHLEKVRVFAGKGVQTPYYKAWKYVKKHPETKEEDWQHVKALGTVDYYGEPRRAEIHWSQCESVGIDDMFVKEWLE